MEREEVTMRSYGSVALERKLASLLKRNAKRGMPERIAPYCEQVLHRARWRVTNADMPHHSELLKLQQQRHIDAILQLIELVERWSVPHD
jgi:hypothetical protein